jgi:hypothetical protein
MSSDTMAAFREHLELLGYRTDVQEDGWTFAAHAVRPDIFLKDFAFGTRVVALYELGTLDDEACDEWLRVANRCNDGSLLVKFALATREDGMRVFRASAVFQGGYERVGFGVFMDAWHSDLGLMSHAPVTGDPAAEDDEDEEGAGRLPTACSRPGRTPSTSTRPASCVTGRRCSSAARSTRTWASFRG